MIDCNPITYLEYGSYVFLFFGILVFIVSNEFLMLGLGIVGINLSFILEKLLFIDDCDYLESQNKQKVSR